jgi:hypothetical protein
LFDVKNPAGTLAISALYALAAVMMAAGAEPGETFASAARAAVRFATAAGDAPALVRPAPTVAIDAEDPPVMSDPTAATDAAGITPPVMGEVTVAPLVKRAPVLLTAGAALGDGGGALPPLDGSGEKIPPTVAPRVGPVTSDPLPDCASAADPPSMIPAAAAIFRMFFTKFSE